MNGPAREWTNDAQATYGKQMQRSTAIAYSFSPYQMKTQLPRT
jgi:hypothetical protein